MLTHQLACINISFSNRHFKPFNSTIQFYPSHIIHAPHVKQQYTSNFTWTILVQLQSELFLTVPNRAVGCPWVALSPSIGSTLWNQESMDISGLTHTQNHYHAFLNKEYPSRRKPLPFGVCRNSTKPMSTRSPCSVDQLLILLRREPTVRTTGNLERSWTLSLSKTIFSPSLSDTRPKMGKISFFFLFN